MLRLLILIIVSLFWAQSSLTNFTLVNSSCESHAPISEEVESEEVIHLSENTLLRNRQKNSNEKIVQRPLRHKRLVRNIHPCYVSNTPNATPRILASRNGLGFAIVV